MNKKKIRVVFLTISPFTNRDYERFGIEILIKNSINVEVIYIGYLVYGIENKIYDFDMVTNVHSYNELEDIVLRLKGDTFFVKLFGLSSKTIKVDFLLSTHNVLSVGINQNIIPMSIKKVNFFNKIRLYFKTLSIYEIFQKIRFLYYLRVLKIKINNYMILGGIKSDNFKNSDDIIKIWTHTLDYDLFLKQKIEYKKIVEYNYCLYLDEYVPYHPDFKKIGVDRKYRAIADIYYKKMNSFFDNIEKNYNLKVIIAAHPRAEYEKIGNVWNGREIIYGKTIELVRDADFCMMHASTSINFCILYQKPILFLTLKELEPLYGLFIDSFSQEIGSSKIFIDDEFNKDIIENSLIVNAKEYSRYKENYIKKSGTPEKNSWQIFADFILEEHGDIKDV